MIEIAIGIIGLLLAVLGLSNWKRKKAEDKAKDLSFKLDIERTDHEIDNKDIHAVIDEFNSLRKSERENRD